MVVSRVVWCRPAPSSSCSGPADAKWTTAPSFQLESAGRTLATSRWRCVMKGCSGLFSITTLSWSWGCRAQPFWSQVRFCVPREKLLKKWMWIWLIGPPCIPVILALGRLKEQGYKFQANLNYATRIPAQTSKQVCPGNDQEKMIDLYVLYCANLFFKLKLTSFYL